MKSVTKIKIINSNKQDFLDFLDNDYNGKILKIHAVEISQSGEVGQAGEVLSSDKKDGIVVSAGGGAVRITELQIEGAKRMSAHDFLLGRTLEKGAILGKTEADTAENDK